MEQILQNTAPTISVTFEADGQATNPDPDSATVEILRSDGSVLVDETAATEAGEGKFTFKLVSAKTADLDTLTARWTATFDDEPQIITTRLSIVGGFYFTTSELKAAFGELADKTSAVIAKERTTVEDIIERAIHFACVPRYRRFVFSGNNWTRLGLPLYYIRSVRSASVDGATVDVSTLKVADSSVYFTRWTRGFSNVILGVEHGLDEPPPRLKEAAMLLCKDRLIKGPIDDRATGIPAGEAGGVITLATPGQRGSVTGLPEVDAAIAQEVLPKITPVSISLADPGNLYPPLPVW